MKQAQATSSKGVRVEAFVQSDRTRALVESWCIRRGLTDYNVTEHHDPADAAGMVTRSARRILIVEAGDPLPLTLERLEQLAEPGDDTSSVIAVLDNPTSSDLRRLFRRGLSDVLSSVAVDADLSNALDTALERLAPVPSAGHLIAVLKSAGGIGGTTIAANLACELAQANAGRVALVDLDVQFGGVEVALDLKPRINFTDAIRAGSRLDETMLKSMMTRHKMGFDVLPGSKAIAPIDVLTEEFCGTFTQKMKSAYDYTVLDMPMTWSPWFFDVLDACDIAMPIVESTVRSADGTRRITQALQDLGIRNLTIVPVANRSTRSPSHKDRLKSISDILGVSVELTVREDTKIAAAAADVGECFRQTAPNAAVTGDVQSIAKAVHSAVGAELAEPVATSNGSRLSFLRGRS